MVQDEVEQFRYRIRREDDSRVIARFTDVEGFFIGTWRTESEFGEDVEEWPDPLTITLVDPELDPDFGTARGNLFLDVLDRDGRPIGDYWLSSATVEGDRATVEAWVTKYPHRDAGSVWERWRSGPPTEPNEWAKLPAGRREGWLEVVGNHHFAARRGLVDTPRTEVVLDGRFVTDLAGFFCAVGEAVNGPGGYYGWNTAAFLECLGNGFGTEGDYTVIWEHSEVAREHLATVVQTADGPSSYFEILLSCFRYRRKKVVLR